MLQKFYIPDFIDVHPSQLQGFTSAKSYLKGSLYRHNAVRSSFNGDFKCVAEFVRLCDN